MSGILAVEHLRPAAAIVWALACVLLIFPAGRALLWRDRRGDPWKAVAFFCGVLFCAFPSRQMVRPADMETRQALFVLSILLAIYVVVLEVRDWREGRG